MNAPRRMALVLMAYAARSFPPERALWADAMRGEMLQIENDNEALRWALGCVLTSYRERVLAMAFMDTRAARMVLALLLFYWAMRELFAPTHLLHNFANGLADMGVRAADLDRFNSLLGLTPLWLQALWTAAAVACLLSAWALLRARPVAFAWFLGAAAFEVLATMGVHLLDNGVPAYHQAALTAYSFAAPGLKRDVIFPAMEALLLASIAGALWLSVGRNAKQA
jgi:hypothetical protein